MLHLKALFPCVSTISTSLSIKKYSDKVKERKYIMIRSIRPAGPERYSLSCLKGKKRRFFRPGGGLQYHFSPNCPQSFVENVSFAYRNLEIPCSSAKKRATFSSLPCYSALFCSGKKQIFPVTTPRDQRHGRRLS